ncbi:lysosomal dipeptide transporter MFSD1-like [Ptychodera flava]|uniref:lysosomal dipeptide transporter MFSD1-like n=1 Tax=Ptychodera flava TaxID=63121 RepID=UPI003969F7C2
MLHASDASFRFIILFFNCMLTFGSYFCFDMPSVLQDVFQGNISCSNTTHGNNSGNPCDDGLGMTADQYNLLYAIYAWTNAVVVLGAGFLVDKLGNRVGLFLFSGLCLLGSSVFALGELFKGTSAMLPVMLVGRLLFGSGNGSLTIVQNRITAYWFRNKELAFAFGMTLTLSRAGSVLNFFLTPNFEKEYGLRWTLWGGAILCGLGFVSAIILSFLDIIGIKQLGQEANVATQSKKLRLRDIKYFSLQFWLLALTIMFFYNGVFPFVADASKFIQNKYGYDPTTSSYMAGSVYDVSLGLSWILGLTIDYIGKRGILAFCCAIFTIPVFGLLAFAHVHPLVSTIWLGLMYSMAAASMWPSIPLVVSQATVGTAMGITTSIQMIGIGISNVVVGEILGSNNNISSGELLRRWKFVMIFLLANTLACVASTVSLNIVDMKRGGVLNMSRWQKLSRASETASVECPSPTDGDVEGEPSETDRLLPPKSSGSIN